MKRICAWCGEALRVLGSELDAQDIITRGLCKDCRYHLFAQMGMPLSEYLDGLEVPIIVVDGSGTIKTANQRARFFLKKDLPMIEGFEGGDVFECVNAQLPEGCGKTIHSIGCTIRRTVMETFSTGRSRLRVPARLNHATPGSTENIQFLISTEKAGDAVLLRIDAADGHELQSV